jgi:hypothetical protein
MAIYSIYSKNVSLQSSDPGRTVVRKLCNFIAESEDSAVSVAIRRGVRRAALEGILPHLEYSRISFLTTSAEAEVIQRVINSWVLRTPIIIANDNIGVVLVVNGQNA